MFKYLFFALLLNTAACLTLICPAQASDSSCTFYRGTVFLFASDGSYTFLDNQELYSYDVQNDPFSWTIGSFLNQDDPLQTYTSWSFIVDWFSLEDTYPICQFSLGIETDELFYDSFEG